MKVLLLNDYATPTGGAEIQMRGLRSELRKRGHDARLFASTAGRAKDDGQADYDCFGTSSRGRTLLQAANVAAAARLRDVVTTFKPDVVHVMMFLTQLSPLVLPVLRRVPSIYHVVWHRPICPTGTKMLPDGSICRQPWGTACYRNSCLSLQEWGPLMLQQALWQRWKGVFDLFLANSEVMKRALDENGFGPVDVLWSGTPVVDPRGPLQEPPTVAFVGRLVREKGVDILIRAFARVAAQMPAARLVIVGDGPERSTAEQLIASLGLQSQVRLCGALSRADAEIAVRDAWIQVAPGRWVEPLGHVALEAQMRGTAMVASRLGGFCETIEDGITGCLIPAADEVACAATILDLLGDRERAEAMGRAGRARALALFGEPAMVDRLIGVYDRVIQARLGNPR